MQTAISHNEHQPDRTETEKCELVIDLVDSAITRRWGESISPGKRELLCGIAAYLTKHAVEYERADVSRDWAVGKVTNVWKILAVANGHSMQDVEEMDSKIRNEYVYPEETARGFIHAVCIIQQGQHYFLADLTFCQFVDSDTGLIGAGPHKPTGLHVKDSFVAAELLKSGFFEITAATLTDYLRITTKEGTVIPQIDETNITRLLAECPPLDESYEKKELDNVLFSS